jgi:hypothetical protein
MPINTKVVSSNPAHSEVYSIQNYVIKLVSDLRQVSGFALSLEIQLSDGNGVFRFVDFGGIVGHQSLFILSSNKQRFDRGY